MQKQTAFIILACAGSISCLQLVYERINVFNVNEKYVQEFFCKVIRVPRKGPHQYSLNCQLTTKVCLTDNATLHMVFYERLTYTYQRSIFSMHLTLCAFLKDPFIGAAFFNQGARCPFVANTYKWFNLTADFRAFPSPSPYERGYLNVQFNITKTNEPIFEANLYLRLINSVKQTSKIKNKRV